MAPADVEIRRTSDADRREVLNLLRVTLGWQVDEQHDALFRWKHIDNPFGTSPAWVATIAGRVAGFRTLMRWEFEDGEHVVRALRAVDTATAPWSQGRGVFTALTRRALGDAPPGFAFVFNTPNAASRPGYLKLGWSDIGRVPIGVRTASPLGVARMARARVPAGLWVEPTTQGLPAPEVLAETTAVASLLAARAGPAGLRTRLDPDVLRWRYGEPMLGYRVVTAGRDLGDGFAIVRVRRRGPAREAALCEVLVPGDDRHQERALVRRVRATFDADYVLAAGRLVGVRAGVYPIPRAGPRLVWLGLDDTAPPRSWSLGLGDVELF